MTSYKRFQHIGIALDPIHVGTGGAQLGRVDLTIVRDPVTKIPKIPGSSLAGVYRAYVAMDVEKYPNCAGIGLEDRGGHCRQRNCEVCTVFGFAKGKDHAGGFAGLAAFTDAHILLFPVATRQGPLWITSPMALRLLGKEVNDLSDNAIYRKNNERTSLNLGWLLLPVKQYSNFDNLVETLRGYSIPEYILNRFAIVSDKLFMHVVNSNLEVRTSVSINPETGAAEEHALFSYEALPRSTVLYWEIICKNPSHFRIDGENIPHISDTENNMDAVHNITKKAHPYLEHLGIGGMGTRGMGRLKVLYAQASDQAASEDNTNNVTEHDATSIQDSTA